MKADPILVFDAGSSSLKFGVFSVGGETHEIFKGSYERFRDGGCEYRFRHGESDERGPAPFGSPAKEPLPAPAGNSVTLAGMSNTTQCQNPLPVGASGS